MRGLNMIVGLTITAALAFGCDVEDVEPLSDGESVEFRLVEDGEEGEVDAEFGEVVAPKIAELYDNCAPLSGCGGPTCAAGGCWYQPQGSIWKIAGTDMPCHHTVNGDCRCNIASKAAVDAALVAAGWTIGGDAPRMADDDYGESCEPVSEVF